MKWSAYLLMAMIFISFCLMANADEPSQRQQQYRDSIQNILSGEDFNQKRTDSGWRWRDRSKENKDDNNEETPEWLIQFIEFLEALADKAEKFADAYKTIALIIEVVFWGLLAALIIYILYRCRQPFQRWLDHLSANTIVREMPTTVAGLKITQESLPDDVITVAKNHWQQHEYRDAMSLLYRAALSQLVYRYGCRLLSSYTEQECYLAACQLNQIAISALMKDLTQCWQQLAYAHQVPKDEVFYQLTHQWQTAFHEQGLNNEK